MSALVRSIPDMNDGSPVTTGPVNLARNELPWPPPATVRQAARRAAADLNRYPDMTANSVVDRVARLHGVPPDHVVLGAGSAALLRDLLLALGVPSVNREVMFAAPAFDLYHSLPRQVGGEPVAVPLRAGRQDLQEMAGWIATRRTAAVLLSNPHNPTGHGLNGDELEAFLDRVPAKVPVVLDEAYSTFVTDPDMPNGLCLNKRHPERERTRPNLIVLRSFSTDYGLAGARIGYLVASPPIAARVRQQVLPFSVTQTAIAAAAAALDAEETGAYDEIRATVIHERAQLRTALLDAGYQVPESQGPYLWLELDNQTTTFGDHCARHNLTIRAYPDHGGVRVSIGQPADNLTFLAAARSFPTYSGNPTSSSTRAGRNKP